MTSLSSFLDMGGYGAFVWPSFGLSALLLVGIFVISVRSLKANRVALAALNAESPPASPNQSKGSAPRETQA